MTEKKTFWDYTLEVLAENKASADELCSVDVKHDRYTAAEFREVAIRLESKGEKRPTWRLDDLDANGTWWKMEWNAKNDKWLFYVYPDWDAPPRMPLAEAILPWGADETAIIEMIKSMDDRRFAYVESRREDRTGRPEMLGRIFGPRRVAKIEAMVEEEKKKK